MMSSEDAREQKISFAYGNAHLHNPNITREMVREQLEKLEQEAVAEKPEPNTFDSL